MRIVIQPSSGQFPTEHKCHWTHTAFFSSHSYNCHRRSSHVSLRTGRRYSAAINLGKRRRWESLQMSFCFEMDLIESHDCLFTRLLHLLLSVSPIYFQMRRNESNAKNTLQRRLIMGECSACIRCMDAWSNLPPLEIHADLPQATIAFDRRMLIWAQVGLPRSKKKKRKQRSNVL